MDGIGDIPPMMQTKLLKVIENKKLYPVGSNTAIEVDFRFVTETNKDLQIEIEKENFRRELFYRLYTITIEISPFRQRKEDLPALIDYFFEKSQVDMKKRIVEIEEGVIEFSLAHDYPGNVRELRNPIERLIVLSDDGIIKKDHLPGGVPQHHVEDEITFKGEIATIFQTLEQEGKQYKLIEFELEKARFVDAEFKGKA